MKKVIIIVMLLALVGCTYGTHEKEWEPPVFNYAIGVFDYSNFMEPADLAPDEHIGILRQWSHRFGYGFIRMPNGEDIFVHYTEMPLDEDDNLLIRSDHVVVFKVVTGKHGPITKSVRHRDLSGTFIERD